MISLGVGELIAACSIIVVAFFGGEEGISGDRTMGPLGRSALISATQRGSVLPYRGLAAARRRIAHVLYFPGRRPGAIANAVRDNEERAEFLGYSQRACTVYLVSALPVFLPASPAALFAINFEILTEENLNLVSSAVRFYWSLFSAASVFLSARSSAPLSSPCCRLFMSLYTEIWSAVRRHALRCSQ